MMFNGLLLTSSKTRAAAEQKIRKIPLCKNSNTRIQEDRPIRIGFYALSISKCFAALKKEGKTQKKEGQNRLAQ